MSVNRRCAQTAAAAERQPAALRAAFTLLELVLALAVVAVIIGLASPALMRFAGEQSLKKDAQLVRSRLALARLTAMESGLTMQFRFEPNGRRCIVLPNERPLGLPATVESPSASNVTVGESQQVQLLELKEDHRFLSRPPGPAALSQPEMVERIPEEWLVDFGGSSALAQVGWSSPILFSPDGTAEDGALVIADTEGRFQTLSVRGLTGAVTVGPVEREQER